MPDIDKLSLEIESKANQSTNGIENLIRELEELDNQMSTSIPNLKSLKSSFRTLKNTTDKLNTIDFSKLNASIGELGNSFKKIKDVTSGYEGTANNIKGMSSAINSVTRSFTKMSEMSVNVGSFDISKLDTQTQSLSKLASYSESLVKLKDISKSINSLVRSLEGLNKLDFNKTLKSIDQLSVGLKKMKDSVEDFGNSSEYIKTMSSAMRSLSKAIEKMSKSQEMSNLDLSKMNFTINKYNKTMGNPKFSNATGFVSMGIIVRELAHGFGYLLNSTNDYIETLNLFNVAMGDSTRRAWNFIESLESIGVDQEQAMRFQASFYDISKSLGLSAKNAYTLSEQFTKLSYDYASLYNIPIENAFEKLQAAAVGTVEPIRRLGKDITIAKLQEIAYSLGIEKKVRSMTQAERAELRFIAVMQQSNNAMNDMERTINAPANSLRVLQAQLKSLAREIGNIFVPILKAVLPWLIAITKFIREIIGGITGFFGLKLGEIDFGGVNTQLGTTDDLSGDVADNLDKAGKNAKKMKDALLGIDELNILNQDTGTIDKGVGGIGGIGGVGGGGLGLNLEDFGYDTILESVKTKADSILETLRKWKKPILIAGTLLGGAWLLGKMSKLIALAKMGGLGLTQMGNVTAGVATVFSSLGGYAIPVLAGIAAATWASFKVFDMVHEKTNDWALSLASASSIFLGPLSWGIYGIYEAFQPVVKQVNELGAGISDVTKDKLEPMIDTWKDLDKAIVKLDWTDKIIDDKDVAAITSKTHTMVEGVLNELSSDRNQSLKDLDLLRDANGNFDKSSQELYNKTVSYYDDTENSTKKAESRINEILNTAKKEKRALKDEEVEELKKLEEEIRDNAITTMSESEKEQTLIMTRLKHNTKALTVETGSELLQEAKKNYNSQVGEAENWRDRMLLNLDQRFGDEADMSNTEYAKQYQIIQNGYQDQLDEAKGKYDQINSTVKEKLGDQYVYIDESTGKIKSNWRGTLDNIKNTIGEKSKDIDRFFREKIIDPIKKAWGKFSSFDWAKDLWAGLTSSIGGLSKKVDKLFTDNVIKPIKKAWNGLTDWWDDTKINPSNWFDGGKGKSRTLSLDTQPYSSPKITAFARGGFVPKGASFVAPDANLWTAGEAGREVLGNFNGRTTVMPLEDTGFVQAMYRAVYDAVRDASDSGQPIQISVQPQVKIGNKDIKQAQENYEFESGKSLIRRV